MLVHQERQRSPFIKLVFHWIWEKPKKHLSMWPLGRKLQKKPSNLCKYLHAGGPHVMKPATEGFHLWCAVSYCSGLSYLRNGRWMTPLHYPPLQRCLCHGELHDSPSASCLQEQTRGQSKYMENLCHPCQEMLQCVIIFTCTLVKNNDVGMIIYIAEALEHNPPTRFLIFWHVTELQKRDPYLQGLNSKISLNKGNVSADKWFDNEFWLTYRKLCLKAANACVFCHICRAVLLHSELSAINFLLIDNRMQLLS